MLIHQFVSLQVATLHRQREVIQTDGSICLRNVTFIIYLFHNFSNNFKSNNSWFTMNFLLSSKNNIGVTSQLECYWLHMAGVWYRILTCYTRWKHDTEFSIQLIFKNFYYIQIIYRYIIKIGIIFSNGSMHYQVFVWGGTLLQLRWFPRQWWKHVLYGQLPAPCSSGGRSVGHPPPCPRWTVKYTDNRM